MNPILQIKQIKASTTWALRQRIMWPDKPVEFVKLPKDEEGVHFGLFKNDKLVSVVSLFIDENNAQFRKLATEKEERGNGYASKLLEHVFSFASIKEVQSIWCNARKDKIFFYEKVGMMPTREEFQKEGIEFKYVLVGFIFHLLC